jgi:hypothetical protein
LAQDLNEISVRYLKIKRERMRKQQELVKYRDDEEVLIEENGSRCSPKQFPRISFSKKK